MFLTRQEIADLTDRETKPAQCRRLRAMKIPYLYEPGGEIKVLNSAIEHRSMEKVRPHYAPAPDFTVFPKTP